MPILKIATINILNDLSLWEERRGWLVQGLSELDADIIALQEVKLPENNANWLAEQLGGYSVFLTPKTGVQSKKEGIAILSRLPVKRQAVLDLHTQERVAQLVQVQLDNQAVLIANGHFYWQPGDSEPRNQQVEQLLAWIEGIPGRMPIIICGDFNGTPESTAIQKVRSRFASAYAITHGREPDYTCPTPLPRSHWSQLRTLLGFFLLIRPSQIDFKWRGTLDYIFVNPRVRVLNCRLALDQPAPGRKNIYPSDHFGLCAILEIME